MICSEFFQATSGLATNPTRLYICSGLGRTGTRSLELVFEKEGISTQHAAGVVTYLTKAAFPDNSSASIRDNFVALMPLQRPPRALLDIPVNVFTWDLMDAYPNSSISLTVRWVCDSLANILVHVILGKQPERLLQHGSWLCLRRVSWPAFTIILLYTVVCNDMQ